MNRSVTVSVFVAAIAAAAGVIASIWWVAPQETPDLVSGTRLSEPRPLPEFTMVQHSGEPFTVDNFHGRWTLVFFGFTDCPDICPTTLFRLDGVVDQLSQSERSTPAVVFVSVDPERDTPEKLAEYVGYFNPSFTAVTGDEENLRDLAQAMSVAYEVKSEDGNHTVTHSSAVLAIDPQARLAALFTPPHKTSELAADIVRLMSAQ